MKKTSPRFKEYIEIFRTNWDNTAFYRTLLIHLFVKPYFRFRNKNRGTSIFDEEWDQLIILDACRYDRFKTIFENEFEAKLKENGLIYRFKYFISLGSNTKEFLVMNFAGRKLDDVIYVTANPMVDLFFKKWDTFKIIDYIPGKVYKLVSVWKYAWNKKLGTVLPEDVAKYALKYYYKYPDKRLIVHFVQPHAPYITKPEINIYKGLEALAEKANNPKYKRKIGGALYRLSKYISEEEFWKAYDENLKIVLGNALSLALIFKGKTVITADHGETFKKRLYFPIPITLCDHPSGLYIEDLVKVPWLEVYNEEKGERCDEISRLRNAISRFAEKEKRKAKDV